MAGVALFFSRPSPTQILRTIGDQVAPLILDATLKENFTGTAEPTQHPVEKGADITDHVILKPSGLTISGIISETPLGDFLGAYTRTAGASVGAAVGSALGKFGAAAGVVGAIGGAIGGGSIAKSISGAIFGSKDRVLGDIANEFDKVRKAKLPISIQTGLKLYESYILTSFSVSRDGGEKGTGRAVKIDLEFKELIIAESRITDVAIPKLKGAIGKANLGRQSLGDLDADKNKRGASILKKLFGGAS